MNADTFVLFALQIAAMLACALACGWCMQRLHQPVVLGEMLGGVVLGPTVFGALLPAGYAWLFPDNADVTLARNAAIRLGMLLFLFVVGLEISLDELRRHGLAAIAIGLAGSLVPLAAGVALVYFWPEPWGAQAREHCLDYGLFIGAALANTANPVLARILMELKLLTQPLGATLMTAAIADDLVGWTLLAVVVDHYTGAPAAGASGLGMSAVLVLAFFAATLVLGRYLGTPLLRWARARLEWPVGFLGIVTVLVLVAAAAAEQLGIHAFLGPFLVGISLAPTSQERGEAYDVIQKFVLSFFAPIYMVSLGLTVNFLRDFDAPLVGLVLLVASVSKISSVYLAARLTGLPSRTAWAVGCGMNARGAIGIILAGIGKEHGIIDDRVYVALVVMALVTSLAAGPLMKWLLRLNAQAA